MKFPEQAQLFLRKHKIPVVFTGIAISIIGTMIEDIYTAFLIIHPIGATIWLSAYVAQFYDPGNPIRMLRAQALMAVLAAKWFMFFTDPILEGPVSNIFQVSVLVLLAVALFYDYFIGRPSDTD